MAFSFFLEADNLGVILFFMRGDAADFLGQRLKEARLLGGKLFHDGIKIGDDLGDGVANSQSNKPTLIGQERKGGGVREECDEAVFVFHDDLSFRM